MLLKTWQSSKNHTLAKLLQGVRQQVTWRTLLGGGNLDHVYLKGDMGIELKPINLSTVVITVETW